MNSGDFLTGLQGLVKWTGNLILPVIAAYCVVLGLMAFHRRQDGERYILAALACLLGPGLASLAEAFVMNTPANSHDAFYNALLNLINWIGNVIMPMFAGYNVVRGILVMGGVMERFNIGDDWLRYFLVAFGCVMVSGIMRLLEWFVTQGASTHITGSLVVPFVQGGHLWV